MKDNLSIKDKCFDFVWVPKCPLFRDSTVMSKGHLILSRDVGDVLGSVGELEGGQSLSIVVV